jgi:hypothetical protein
VTSEESKALLAFRINTRYHSSIDTGRCATDRGRSVFHFAFQLQKHVYLRLTVRLNYVLVKYTAGIMKL